VQLPIASLLAPIASISLLVVGSSFLTTFTSMHLHSENVSNWMVGFISSAHFSGYVISSYMCQNFIFRVGHIRAFAAFASIIGVVALIQGLFFSPSLWLVLRFMSGYSLAGICVVIESWLMAGSTLNTRGTVLAVYMLTYYIAQSFSQLILHVSFAHVLMAYALITIFASLSIMPVSVTRFSAPCPENPQILSFKFLIKKAKLGVIGCFCAGLILGPLYTLVPVYLQQNDKLDSEVAWVMFSLIMGGTLLQYPIGKLSDRVDRRKVLAFMLFGCIVAFGLFIIDVYSTGWLMMLAGFMGACSFLIYPLSISYTIDHIENEHMVSAVASLLLAYGVGSTIGPLLPSVVMDWLGPNGLCYYLLVISCVVFLYTMKIILTRAPEIEEQTFDFAAQPRTTPEAVPVDPEYPPVDVTN
jgi:MFS family permease